MKKWTRCIPMLTANEPPRAAETLTAGNLINLRGMITNAVHTMANKPTLGFKQIIPVVNGVPVSQGVDGDMTYPMDVRNYRDLTAGVPKATGNPLDVALSQGYFAIQTDQGIAYTQAGQFTIHPENGTLVTLHSLNPVLDEGGGEIPVDGPITIASDGSITNDEGEFISRLGVFGFNEDPTGAAEQSMMKIGNNLYTSEQELEPLINPTVLQGFVESSNADVPLAMIALEQLVEAYKRGTSLNENSYRTQKDIIEKLISV